MTRPSPSSTAEPHDIVVLEGVTKRFPGVVANDSVDLRIRAGEVHVLLGENGAGKSTLIGMLSGLQQPDEGRILVDGKPTPITSPRHALSLGIGTVFQHVMLVPTLTVAENLLLGGAVVAAPRASAQLEARVAEIARSLGIDGRPRMPRSSELSLGEQQQVEILRALLRNSRLLILDESTSMLTPQGIEELGALMRRLVEQGLAIVFITHKLEEAAAFGDRISVLQARPQGRRDRAGAAAVRSARRPPSPRSSSMMFGKQTDDPEAERHAGAFAQPDAAPLLEVRDLSVAPHGGLARPVRGFLRHSRRAKSSASPASTATARSSWPRRWPASLRPRGGSIVLDGARHRSPWMSASAARRAALPDRRPAGRRHGRRLSRLDQLLPQAGRRGAVLAPRLRAARRDRRHAPASWCANTTCARPA